MHALLLPGMDGTGRLFAALARALPGDVVRHVDVVSYPPSEPLGYDALLERIVFPSGDVVVVAESFSGPLGIRLAARHGERVRALILAATFARTPSRLVPLAAPFARPLFWCTQRFVPPPFALRAFLLGRDALADDVAALRDTLQSVSPAVMAKRLADIAAVDVSAELARVRSPALYIRATRDRLVGAAGLASIRASLPSVEVVDVDAPHLVLQRRPAECAALISAFVARAVSCR